MRRINPDGGHSTRTLRRMKPRTASGKAWKVLAKKSGTLRNIGDGTPKRLQRLLTALTGQGAER